MSEEQLNASLDAEGAKPLEEGAAADVELTDEELAGVAGGSGNTDMKNSGEITIQVGPIPK